MADPGKLAAGDPPCRRDLHGLLTLPPRPWLTIAPARTTLPTSPVPRVSLFAAGVYDSRSVPSIINCSTEGASVLGRNLLRCWLVASR